MKMSAYDREHLNPIAQPFICRMFSSLNVKLLVYKNVMSIVTKKAPFGKGSILSSLLIKSLIYDFNFCTIG